MFHRNQVKYAFFPLIPGMWIRAQTYGFRRTCVVLRLCCSRIHYMFTAALLKLKKKKVLFLDKLSVILRKELKLSGMKL